MDLGRVNDLRSERLSHEIDYPPFFDVLHQSISAPLGDEWVSKGVLENALNAGLNDGLLFITPHERWRALIDGGMPPGEINALLPIVGKIMKFKTPGMRMIKYVKMCEKHLPAVYVYANKVVGDKKTANFLRFQQITQGTFTWLKSGQQSEWTEMVHVIFLHIHKFLMALETGILDAFQRYSRHMLMCWEAIRNHTSADNSATEFVDRIMLESMFNWSDVREIFTKKQSSNGKARVKHMVLGFTQYAIETADVIERLKVSKQQFLETSHGQEKERPFETNPSWLKNNILWMNHVAKRFEKIPVVWFEAFYSECTLLFALWYEPFLTKVKAMTMQRVALAELRTNMFKEVDALEALDLREFPQLQKERDGLVKLAASFAGTVTEYANSHRCAKEDAVAAANMIAHMMHGKGSDREFMEVISQLIMSRSGFDKNTLSALQFNIAELISIQRDRILSAHAALQNARIGVTPPPDETEKKEERELTQREIDEAYDEELLMEQDGEKMEKRLQDYRRKLAARTATYSDIVGGLPPTVDAFLSAKALVIPQTELPNPLTFSANLMEASMRRAEDILELDWCVNRVNLFATALKNRPRELNLLAWRCAALAFIVFWYVGFSVYWGDDLLCVLLKEALGVTVNMLPHVPFNDTHVFWNQTIWDGSFSYWNESVIVPFVDFPRTFVGPIGAIASVVWPIKPLDIRLEEPSNAFYQTLEYMAWFAKGVKETLTHVVTIPSELDTYNFRAMLDGDYPFVYYGYFFWNAMKRLSVTGATLAILWQGMHTSTVLAMEREHGIQFTPGMDASARSWLFLKTSGVWILVAVLGTFLHPIGTKIVYYSAVLTGTALVTGAGVMIPTLMIATKYSIDALRNVIKILMLSPDKSPEQTAAELRLATDERLQTVQGINVEQIQTKATAMLANATPAVVSRLQNLAQDAFIPVVQEVLNLSETDAKQILQIGLHKGDTALLLKGPPTSPNEALEAITDEEETNDTSDENNNDEFMRLRYQNMSPEEIALEFESRQQSNQGNVD